MSVIIKLEFDVQEVNAVLAALGQQPYSQVEPLINKIREQALPQVQALEAPPEPTPVAE